jgi:hypothetical protein
MLNVSVSDQYSFCTQPFNYQNAEEINEKQKQILVKIQTEHYENTALKAVCFVRDNPGTVALALIPTTRECAVLCAYEVAIAPIAVPVCCIPGGIPYGVGLFAGVFVSWYGIVTIDKLSQIKDTDFYHNWKATRNRMLKKEHLNDYLMQDNQLKYFVCNLSGKLPIIPVKIKGTDMVFDFEELERWNHENPGKVFPLTRKVLNLQS